MKEFKGTKGDWTTNFRGSNTDVHSEGKIIACAYQLNNYEKDALGNSIDCDIAIANAKLIAAAPEMLKALIKLIDPLTGMVYDSIANNMDDGDCEIIEKAINKAL